MDSYGDWYGTQGPMRMRGRGRSTRGRSGPFGPRGGGMMRQGGFGGPGKGMGQMRPGPFENANDPKYLKQCILYLENVKKNVPTNKDHLSVYCVACTFLAKNNQEFFNHRDTVKHNRQMEKIEMMPEGIRKAVNEVITSVFRQRVDQKTLLYCDMCDEKLRVPYSDHKNVDAHQIRSKAARAGCISCKTGPMKNYPAYKEHCSTEEHKEKSETFLNEQREKIANCKRENDFPPFQEGAPIGTEYVVEAEGYYCNLCRKFLHDKEDMEVHSKVQRHFNRVRELFFENKKREPLDMGDYTLPQDDKKEEEEADVDQENEDSVNNTEEAMETS